MQTFPLQYPGTHYTPTYVLYNMTKHSVYGRALLAGDVCYLSTCIYSNHAIIYTLHRQRSPHCTLV